MVDSYSVPPTVAEAERQLYGPLAEAHALIEIYRRADGVDESVVCLAIATLQRIVDCFDTYHTEMLRHGRPSLPDRQPPSADVPVDSSELDQAADTAHE